MTCAIRKYCYFVDYTCCNPPLVDFRLQYFVCWFSSLLAISEVGHNLLRSCQSKYELWNKVVNFAMNSVVNLQNLTWQKLEAMVDRRTKYELFYPTIAWKMCSKVLLEYITLGLNRNWKRAETQWTDHFQYLLVTFSAIHPLLWTSILSPINRT